jgi:preprotein translocase subunit SecF
VISLLVFGFRYGLDFTGGSLIELEYSKQRATNDQITELLKKESVENVKVQPTGERGVLIRLPEVTEDKHQQLLKYFSDEAKTIVADNTANELRFESFGPSLGSELKRQAMYAILLVLAAIISYLAYAFRKVSHPVPSWKFGTVAVIALIHDVLVLLGIFSLLGHLYGTEIDSLFITALLTLLGFSVHDTIVTLDRVRENLFKHQDETFEVVVDRSINETVSRSINTSLTALFAVTAIYFFGGSSIHDFSLALMIGIIVGTYSSIFIASPLLVTWYNFNRKKD